MPPRRRSINGYRKMRKPSGPRTRINVSEADLKKAKQETNIKVLKKWAESKVRKTRLKAAVNENTPKATLKRLQSDDDQTIRRAAQDNPSMHSSDEDELLNKARSKRSDVRLKTARNPNATAKVLAVLLTDNDTQVSFSVIQHPNIDKGIVDFVMKNLPNKNTMFYIRLLQNKSFDNKWTKEFLEFLLKIQSFTSSDRNTNKLMRVILQSNKFFSNESEWISLLDVMKDFKADDEWAAFWSNFYGLPQRSYESIITEKTVMKMFEYFEQILKDRLGKPGEDYDDLEYICDSIYDIVKTESMKGKLYDLCPKDEFLPQSAKDIFLF